MCGPKFCSMKMNLEVRNFEPKQSSESYLAAENLREKTGKVQANRAHEEKAELSELHWETGMWVYLPCAYKEDRE